MFSYLKKFIEKIKQNEEDFQRSKILDFVQENKITGMYFDEEYLKGHSLEDFHFLGTTDISYKDSNDLIIRSTTLYFFENKETKERKCVIDHLSMRDHTFFSKLVSLWLVKQKEIYTPIHQPSDYLKSYMLSTYSVEWIESDNWWGKSENTKYNKTLQQQKKLDKNHKTPIINDEGENLVKLDFSNKKNKE